MMTRKYGVQFHGREIRYETLPQKGISLQDHCSLCGRIPWDFYQRGDFDDNANAVGVARSSSF